MVFNPVTAISEQIQKLITEHGSAAVLRDHLALIKDQVFILEKKNAELLSDNATLTSKVEVLETKKQELIEENYELKQIIDKHNQPHDNLLDNQQITILVVLSRKQDSVQTKAIASLIGINNQLAKFHLEELKKKKLVKHSRGLQGANRGNDVWSLAQEGRRYLVTHNLIS